MYNKIVTRLSREMCTGRRSTCGTDLWLRASGRWRCPVTCGSLAVKTVRESPAPYWVAACSARTVCPVDTPWPSSAWKWLAATTQDAAGVTSHVHPADTTKSWTVSLQPKYPHPTETSHIGTTNFWTTSSPPFDGSCFNIFRLLVPWRHKNPVIPMFSLCAF